MDSRHYRLDKEGYYDTSTALDHDEEQEQAHRSRWWSYPSWPNIALSILLVIGSIQFTVQSLELRRLRSTKSPPFPWSVVSANAGLTRDVPIAWTPSGKWVNDDQDVEDAVWNSSELDFNKGVVALPDRWAADHGIPLAQRWPWDKHKGVYLLSSTHDVHCLRSLRVAILNGFAGKEPGIDREHAKHCLSILLQDTMCNADDSLLYTGAVWAGRGKQLPSAGEGQYRMCRDWSRLRAWAQERSACFATKNIPGYGTTGFEGDERQFYKNCPDGSAPWLSVDHEVPS